MTSSKADLEKRLKALKEEAHRAQRLASRKGASLEALINARKRTNAIIDRLKGGGVTPAEKKMIPEFQQVTRNLTAKISTARKTRKKQEGILKRARIRIKGVRQRLHKKKGGHGFHGTMQDSIDVNQFINPDAVLGYVGGYWPTYATLQRLYPSLPKASTAINASENADVLDCEPGDATPAEVAAWVKRQNGKCAVYGSVSVFASIDSACRAAGLEPGKDYLRMTAHYTGSPHRCSSSTCGYGFTGEADATQYTDHYQGRNLDASLCAGLPWHN